MLNTHIEDDSGETKITIFSRTAQILIKKPCSMLTFDERYTDQAIIPPTIEQLKGLQKIFQVYFKRHGATTSTIISKIFEDELLEIVVSQSSTTPTLVPKTAKPMQTSLR